MEGKHSPHVRKAWYAGTWYPAQPQQLRNLMHMAAINARGVREGNADAVGPARFWILPHAGLLYAGRGLAHVLDLAPPVVTRVLVIAPPHYVPLEGDRIVFDSHACYQTPLGDLKGSPVGNHGSGSSGDGSMFQREHAVEMVLPFLALLQERQKQEMEVCMALVSRLSSAETVSNIAGRLIALFSKHDWEQGRVLVVASSDFTHYGIRFGYVPYGNGPMDVVADKVRSHDLERAGLLSDGKIDRLIGMEKTSGSTICGLAGAMLVASMASRFSSTGSVVDYYTSRDLEMVGGDNFVAYCTVMWR